MLSFPNAFVKFPWIKECLNAKHLFQTLANLPVRADVYYYGRMQLRLTCPHRHWFVHLGVFFFTVIARTSLLVRAGISFSLWWPVQTKPNIRMFSYHRHNPQKITCPYKRTFTFLCHSLHKPTSPQGHLRFTDISHTGLPAHYRRFLASVTAYTGQPIHMDILSPHRLSHPCRQFLAAATACTGQLVHTDTSFSLT